MANGIFDPNVVEAGTAVKEASFLSKVAPVATALLAGSVLGPAAGIGIGLMQRKSALFDLERAENAENVALADYAERASLAGNAMNELMESLNTYSQVVGVEDSDIELIMNQAQSFFEEAKSLDPNRQTAGREKLYNLQANMLANTTALNSDALMRQRDSIQSVMDETRLAFQQNNEDAVRIISDIEQAYAIVNDPDFGNTPVEIGTVLKLLGNSVETTGSVGAGLSSVPIIGDFIGGVIAAEEVKLEPWQWNELLDKAYASTIGTRDQLNEGYLRYTEEFIEPQARVLKLVRPDASATDYITGAVPKFEAITPERFASKQQDKLTGLERAASEVSEFIGGATRGTGNSLSALGDAFNTERSVVNDILRRVGANASDIGIDANGRTVARFDNGEIKPIQVSDAERRVLELRRQRQVRENRRSRTQQQRSQR